LFWISQWYYYTTKVQILIRSTVVTLQSYITWDVLYLTLVFLRFIQSRKHPKES
jgi:hypothetical protein